MRPLCYRRRFEAAKSTRPARDQAVIVAECRILEQCQTRQAANLIQKAHAWLGTSAGVVLFSAALAARCPPKLLRSFASGVASRGLGSPRSEGQRRLALGSS